MGVDLPWDDARSVPAPSSLPATPIQLAIREPTGSRRLRYASLELSEAARLRHPSQQIALPWLSGLGWSGPQPAADIELLLSSTPSAMAHGPWPMVEADASG